ncbi:heme exporter protein CcmD [Sphingomonas crusticola]|nr:heme exporter protein CcmD [Sphingomonas crusticola]
MSAALDAWPFVLAAYAVTIGGTAALLGWSLMALRRAEARANALNRRRDD